MFAFLVHFQPCLADSQTNIWFAIYLEENHLSLWASWWRWWDHRTAHSERWRWSVLSPRGLSLHLAKRCSPCLHIIPFGRFFTLSSLGIKFFHLGIHFVLAEKIEVSVPFMQKEIWRILSQCLSLVFAWPGWSLLSSKAGSLLQSRLLARFSLGLMGLRFTVFNLSSDGHAKYLFHAMFNFSTAGISVSKNGNKPPVSLYDKMPKTQLGFYSIQSFSPLTASACFFKNGTFYGFFYL